LERQALTTIAETQTVQNRFGAILLIQIQDGNIASHYKEKKILANGARNVK